MLNLLYRGDTLSVNALTSGHGMRYGRLGYVIPAEWTGNAPRDRLFNAGLCFGRAHHHRHTRHEQVASLWARHLLVRSRDTNVNGKIQYDGLKLRDFYSSAIQNDRSLANWTLSLSGDMRDQWLAGGGVNSWSLNWSAGRVAFDNPAARLADAATANTQGSFSK